MQPHSYGARSDIRFEQCAGVRDQRNQLRTLNSRLRVLAQVDEVFCAEVLRFEETIKRMDRKPTRTMQIPGKVRLCETGLPGEQGYGEIATLEFAQQDRTKAFMQLGKVHLWNVHWQATTAVALVRCEETEIGYFAFISGAHLLRHGA